MPSKFESRFLSAAVPQLQRQFGVLICFARGVYVSEEFTARRHESGLFGFDKKTQAKAFILPKPLLIDGESVTPNVGDTIMEMDTIYELQPFESGELCYRVQPGGFEYIVNAVEMSVVGETVSLFDATDTLIAAVENVIVSLDSVSAGRSDGPVERSGLMRFNASEKASVIAAHTCTINGETWDILTVGDVVNSRVLVSISRTDADHTNQFDINDEQAVWRQA